MDEVSVYVYDECKRLHKFERSSAEQVVNIYDIAREAGVSIATVSRVVNGSSKVKESTRTKVEEILNKHRYAPSAFARGMVSGSMRTIGVMTVDIRDIYFGTLTHAVEQAFSTLGYNTLLCNTGGLPEQQLHYLDVLTSKKVDGIILVGSNYDDISLEKAVQATAGRIPVVMVNRDFTGKNIWSVICDEKQGMRDCTAHMLSRGYRDILYIKDTHTYSAARKVSGFRQGMEDAGYSVGDERIIETGKGIEGGIAAVEIIIKSGTPFNALMTGDDVTAAGVVKALHQVGRVPGKEIAVSGFNDSILALSTDPELTSVNSMAGEMGQTAVSILAEVLENGHPPQKTVLNPVLSVRASTLKPE